MSKPTRTRSANPGPSHAATHTAELAALDLNLLVAFEALHAERSVTRAGRRLALSQPGTSGALARLREMLGDELFVRGKGGLVPTARCEELAGPIARALGDLRAALTSGSFDPATTSRTFTVGGVDAALGVLAPAVLAAVHQEAPSARVVVLPIDPVDAVSHLESGALDLALAPLPTVPTTVGARELFEVRGVLAMRPAHPLTRRTRGAPVLPADLAHYPFVMVSFVGSPQSAVDDALAKDGKKRHVAFVLTSFLAVPHVLAETDALAILPAPFARKLAARGEIAVAPLPEGVPFPSLRMRLLWPLPHDAAPASRWLREIVARTAKRIIDVAEDAPLTSRRGPRGSARRDRPGDRASR